MQLSTLHDYIDNIANTDTASYLDADKSAALTRWAHIITEEVIDAQNDLDFQGEIATASLVANQREYTFPTDLLKIKRVDLKLDGTNWTPTTWLDESEISRTIASESDVTEKFNNSSPSISLYDESYFVWSGTISAVTGGIKIWYSEELVGKDTSGDDITSFSSDTDTPNLRAFAQMALIYGAILDFTETRDPELAKRMNIRLYGNPYGRQAGSVGGLIGRIRNYYSTRAPDRQVRVKTASSLEEYE